MQRGAVPSALAERIRLLSKSRTDVAEPAPYFNDRKELLAMAEAIVGSYAVAEELVQESWFRWASRQYDSASIASIQRKIVRNLALDWYRRVRLERAYLAEQRSDPAPDSEQIHLAREDVRRVAAALTELPERTRQAFLLRRVEGLSLSEIGIRLGVSNQRAHQLVRAALVHLDRRLSAQES
ncbi:MAG: sigma-70 family RNA polymerase sigma factor [Pseudomonadota bacterium]